MSNPEIEELVIKMAKGSKLNKAKKVNLDEVDFEKLDEKTKKAYSDFKHGDIDIYKIIGANPTDSHEKIKKKYIEKISKYHPDKHAVILSKYPVESVEKEKKRLMATYKLIKEASAILLNAEKRKFYDLQRKTSDSKNFEKQKDDFASFKKLQESQISEDTKKLAKLDFDKKQLELDKKHGFKREEIGSMTKKDADRKYNDLMMEREQQAIEYTPKKLFDGNNFNIQDFNKHFEKEKKREDKRKKNKDTHDKSVVLWEGVSAANDVGSTGVNFVSVDRDYEDLYVDTNPEASGLAPARLSDNDDNDNDNDNDDNNNNDNSSVSSDGIDVSYVDKNQKGSLSDAYSNFLQQRNLEDKLYDKREMGKDWKTLDENPMNISTQVKIDGAFSSMGKLKYDKNVDEDMVDVYKRIVYEDSSESSK